MDPPHTWKSLGARRLASTPMSAVGCTAREMQYDSGYQYQYCVNSVRPITAVRLRGSTGLGCGVG